MAQLGLGFQALSDATRRTILQLLRDGDLTAGEIADHFEMSKPSISHHLSTLKQAGLVLEERDGRHRRYSLNTTVFDELMGWMLDAFGKGDER